MNGKIVGSFIVASALVVGGTIYYMQEYAYYRDAVFAPGAEITLTTRAGQPEAIAVTDLTGIDADSSPLRFRACFRVKADLPTLTAAYQTYERAEPLIPPSWFTCFDAERIGKALEAGEAVAFLGQAGIASQVDRIVAVFPDGSAFAWHQLQPGAGE